MFHALGVVCKEAWQQQGSGWPIWLEERNEWPRSEPCDTYESSAQPLRYRSCASWDSHHWRVERGSGKSL